MDTTAVKVFATMCNAVTRSAVEQQSENTGSKDSVQATVVRSLQLHVTDESSMCTEDHVPTGLLSRLLKETSGMIFILWSIPQQNKNGES